VAEVAAAPAKPPAKSSKIKAGQRAGANGVTVQTEVDHVADLKRHDGAVNVVRFSPDGASQDEGLCSFCADGLTDERSRA